MSLELCGLCADHNNVIFMERGKVLLCSMRPKDCPGFIPKRNNAENGEEEER